MRYRRMRPAAWAISVWPPSNSTLKVTLGSASLMMPSLTTAASFSGSGGRSGFA